MNNSDIVIVGAGPAGSTAAYYINNYNVLILDKCSFPRDKACAGGLFNSKDWSKEFENFKKIKNKIKFVSNKNLCFYCDKKQIFRRENKHLFDKINRYHFDNLLLKETLKKKNIKFLKFNLKSITQNKESFILKDGNRIIKTKYIIGADGWNSKISEFIGNKKRSIKDYGLCLEYDIICKKKNKDVHLMYFWNNELGYAWVFPSINGYYLGLGFVGKTKKSIKSNLEELLKYSVKKGIVPKKYKIKRIFGAPDPLTTVDKYCNDRIILCGDALGLVNQISGEGIYFAMKSGKFAGKTIDSELNNIKKSFKIKIKPLIKEVTIIKKIPPKFIPVTLFKMFFKLCSWELPFKLNHKFQNTFLNRFFRRYNLPKNSYYTKYD